MFTEPAWLTTARHELGVKEVTGSASNPRILQYAKDIGGWVAEWYKADDVPWCGLFVGWCLKENGIEPPKRLLTARAYAEWGDDCDDAVAGAVLVFSRNGGGHVGFYVGEDDDAFHVLGGNQADAVSVARIAKSRLIATRWPSGRRKPLFARPIIRAAEDDLSTNEA